MWLVSMLRKSSRTSRLACDASCMNCRQMRHRCYSIDVISLRTCESHIVSNAGPDSLLQIIHVSDRCPFIDRHQQSKNWTGLPVAMCRPYNIGMPHSGADPCLVRLQMHPMHQRGFLLR